MARETRERRERGGFTAEGRRGVVHGRCGRTRKKEEWLVCCFDCSWWRGGIQGLVEFACVVGRSSDVGTTDSVAFGIGDLRSGRWHGRETAPQHRRTTQAFS